MKGKRGVRREGRNSSDRRVDNASSNGRIESVGKLSFKISEMRPETKFARNPEHVEILWVASINQINQPLITHHSRLSETWASLVFEGADLTV
jgi:hypothetical protein